MSLIAELKRRNVFRVAVAYAVIAWLLAQIADVALDTFGTPDWVGKTVLFLLVLGFPIAVLFAWAFELTPEGVKREKDVDRSASITQQTGQKLNRFTIAVLVVAVGFLLVDKFLLRTDAPPAQEATTQAAAIEKSIAVLPFIDLSESQDQSWFAQGLADEILNALMRTPDLLVASRTSAFKYDGSDLDIRDIAAELGVAHIVEGSIRRSGDSIRVTAQLIRASDGFHLWSQNYDRELSDVIGIQEDLAIQIARALETGMEPDTLRAMMDAGTSSVEAYQHLLAGRAHRSGYETFGDISRITSAYEEFENARRIDPVFSAAHYEAAAFWRSQLLMTSRHATATSVPPEEALAAFEERIDLAIATASDPATRMLYEAERARVHLEYRRVIELLRRVLTVRPNNLDVWSDYLNAAVAVADFDTANLAMDKLIESHGSNPDSVRATEILITLHRIGRAQEGAEYARQALKTYPDRVVVAYQAHRALLWAGEVEEAAKLSSILSIDAERSAAVSQVRQACAEGRRKDAEQILADAFGEPPFTDGATSAWHVLMLLGRVDDANAIIRANSSADVPYTRAAWLFYQYFDPTPFPELVAILERENIERPPPVEIPFACK